MIANTARELGAVVVVEDLPRNAPKKVIRGVLSKRPRRRLYQAGFRDLIKAIEGGSRRG